jgi:hypothetical protein
LKGKKGGCSRRERLELTAVALVPAALGLLRPMIMLGGRLSWLVPVLALPFGVCLCRVWGRLGEADLRSGLEGAFGVFLGKLSVLAYLLWGLVLLADSARRYSDRLLVVFEGESVRWLFLLSALGVTLWLGRREGGAFARTGRIFFLAVGLTLCGILLLTLRGLDWKNLVPPEGEEWKGLPGAGALCLSLAGYGIYTLCLPRRREESLWKTWPWAVSGCVVLSVLLLIVVGVFGPALAGGMRDPFLYLLEGVQVPGAFRRGEAGLVAILSLADLVLLTLLGGGCMTLWGELLPLIPVLGCVPVAGAFLLAGLLPTLGAAWGRWESILPTGNLVLGILLPALAVLTRGVRERKEDGAIFCVRKTGKSADVAVKGEDKKSGEENEKKC